MSIIYEALKKVEGQKETAAPEIIPQSKAFPVERAKRKVKKAKKRFFASRITFSSLRTISIAFYFTAISAEANTSEGARSCSSGIGSREERD